MIAQCDTACKYSGYDMGTYQDKHCLCSDEKDYNMMIKKRTKLPHFNRNVDPVIPKHEKRETGDW